MTNEPILITKRLRVYRRVLHIRRRMNGSQIKILVKMGDEVKPEDVIGEYQTSSGFTTLDLAARLKVKPQSAAKYLKKKMGQTIYRGELLAQKSDLLGISKVIITAPSDGNLDMYDPQTGILKIKFLSKRETVISGVYGVVDAIDQARGVITVKTMANLLFGVSGSGNDRSGLIRVLGERDSLLSSSHLKEDVKGSILVGGGMVFPDALQKAVHLQVSGLVTGGVDASVFKSMRGNALNFKSNGVSDIGISVVLTEGFGLAPIGEDIYELLKAYNGKFAMIDGNKARLILPSTDPGSIIYIRKTNLPIEEGVEKAPLTSLQEVRIGERVRILYPAMLGIQGVVESIDKQLTHLPSGTSATLATIVTPAQKVRVPVEDLEAVYSI